MQSFQGPEDHEASSGRDDGPGGPASGAPGGESRDRLDAVADEMLAHRTPRQRELAERIWDRFVAGDDVDDVRDLIADLSRTATEDAEKRRAAPGQGGVR